MPGGAVSCGRRRRSRQLRSGDTVRDGLHAFAERGTAGGPALGRGLLGQCVCVLGSGQRAAQRGRQSLYVGLLLLRQPLAKRDRGVDQVLLDQGGGQAAGHGGAGVPDLAEQAGQHGLLRADGAGQHPRVAAARMQAQRREAGVEQCVRADHAHVARQREVESCANGGPVDRGDGRQRAVPDPQETLVDGVDVVEGPVGGTPQRGQFGACAEGAAGPSDHDAAGRLVTLGAVHRLSQSADQRAAEDVASGRIVEGHDRDPVLLLEPDQLMGVVRHALRLLGHGRQYRGPGSIVAGTARPAASPGQLPGHPVGAVGTVQVGHVSAAVVALLQQQ